VTVNFAVLVPVPPGAVTEIGPVEAAAGTVAVILVSDLTVNLLAAPLNCSAVAPVNPDPFTITEVPIVPEAGLKEEMTGAAALAGDAATTAAPRMTASTPSLEEGRRATLTTAQRIRPRITTPHHLLAGYCPAGQVTLDNPCSNTRSRGDRCTKP
jgi:hypothetical protein